MTSMPPRPDTRRVLLVAFHFPPFKGSSGLERTLAFCRNLLRQGWQSRVLSVHPRAYPSASDERMGDIPAEVPVDRAFALDTSRHLSVRGWYPGWAALPDRWISWVFGAVPCGLGIVRRWKPQAIWSTYPIATAHLIGWALHRLTGVPWIADFRDPMVEFNHRKKVYAPANAALRKARLWIEGLCARNAARVVFCTRGALEIFVSRHPGFPREHAVIIPNGYDESSFAGLTPPETPDRRREGAITLLHSGVLYPGPDRDPTAFLTAVRGIVAQRPELRSRLRIVLRATGYDATYAPVIASLGLQDIVELAPAIPYREALAEMLRADVLLVFQGYTSNPAIPAKAYEYLRARRPILALLDADGDTAALFRSAGVGTILPIEDADAITVGLDAFLGRLMQDELEVLSLEACAQYERGQGAAKLASLLDSISTPTTGMRSMELPKETER